MYINLIQIVLVVILLVLFLGAVIRLGYLAWFRPEKFKEERIRDVKDWFPFANYYRSLFNSPRYLWMIRIMTVTILLILILFLLLPIFGALGFLR